MLSKFDLESASAEELQDRLAALTMTLEESLVEACAIIVELRRRGISKPWMRQGIFRYAIDINSGKIHPLLALTMGESPAAVEALTGLPLEKQASLARGETVVVATMHARGHVVAEDQPITTMGFDAFRRVFHAGTIRTFDQQKKILLARSPVVAVRRSMSIETIRVDKAKEELVIGQLRIKATVVASALNELGFDVIRRVPAPV